MTPLMLNVKSSENFLSPDPKVPNFGGFGAWGQGLEKSFDFYCKRHIYADPRRLRYSA